MPSESTELERLRSENARLLAMLKAQGVEVTAPTTEIPPQSRVSSSLSPAEKVALFRRLFRGRTDVYPVRWESKAGKSGYSPACANEWRPGICEKPRIKCSDCSHRMLIPVSDQIFYDHLAGHHAIGVYPLLHDDTCYFLAVDFDESSWHEDAQAFVRSCRELDVPVALEISRSGNGAHAWIFFEAAVPAREARSLGAAIISHTCVSTRQLRLSSYDRLFPNQDTLPKGGYGNLIALPLQRKPRELGHSVFVNDDLVPYPDQWAYLASIEAIPPSEIDALILCASGGSHPLDVTFSPTEDEQQPWVRAPAIKSRLSGPMPEALSVTVSNLLYFEKAELPQALTNRLIRLAAFQNPEFYRAQAMRLPVWDKPRVIGCAENFPNHIALPRGCQDAVAELLQDNDIGCNWHDVRHVGQPLEVKFGGALRTDQSAAVAAMLEHDIGVLSAPTAFGKTVVAAEMIARRTTNTLVLVHRTELMKQWQERLQTFLQVGKDIVGTIGGGKSRPSGKIDIAVMQSLARQGEISDLVENYGHIVIDECHHISAFSFESILKRVRAKFVLGLTATPIRRDGQHPIIFMQCGPIRHRAMSPEGSPKELAVLPRLIAARVDAPLETEIQAIFLRVANDAGRTEMIAADIAANYDEGRKVLVLTERTDHIQSIKAALPVRIDKLFTLEGRMTKKRRESVINELDALPPETPRVLIATGRLVGEGFDHAALDTLILAMPISWRGTLQQYAGRLHREHSTKSDVRIIDYVDAGNDALARMWQKRQRGYRAMGYRIGDAVGREREASTPMV